jgi:hypothetical protein
MPILNDLLAIPRLIPVPIKIFSFLNFPCSKLGVAFCAVMKLHRKKVEKMMNTMRIGQGLCTNL